jgi:hypothetical protein
MVLKALIAAFVMAAGSTAAYAQTIVAVPFKFEAGGKSFAPGDYSIELKGGGAVGLRPAAGGAELLIRAIKTLERPTPAKKEAELVFDMVGNFEPSYSEYVTDYLLSEVWLPGAEGVVVLNTSGAHQHRTVKGQIGSPGGGKNAAPTTPR